MTAGEMAMGYDEQLTRYIARCVQALDAVSQRVLMPMSVVSEAGAYALKGGGKRVRGVLVQATSDMLDGDLRLADVFSAAIEMIHAFSLIHDDLPCMDDDDTRRGRPATHIAFGEANALLAGDMLAIEAFEAIAGVGHDPQRLLEAVRVLAAASGARGMIYGQELDMKFETATADEADLYDIVRNKTGALITASVQLGTIAAGGSMPDLSALKTYADNIGFVFQIVDDILNETSTAEVMGKPVGNDARRGKTTFVSLYGLEEARLEAQRLTDEAVAALRQAHGAGAEFLCWYAESLMQRTK